MSNRSLCDVCPPSRGVRGQGRGVRAIGRGSRGGLRTITGFCRTRITAARSSSEKRCRSPRTVGPVRQRRFGWIPTWANRSPAGLRLGPKQQRPASARWTARLQLTTRSSARWALSPRRCPAFPGPILLHFRLRSLERHHCAYAVIHRSWSTRSSHGSISARSASSPASTPISGASPATVFDSQTLFFALALTFLDSMQTCCGNTSCLPASESRPKDSSRLRPGAAC